MGLDPAGVLAYQDESCGRRGFHGRFLLVRHGYILLKTVRASIPEPLWYCGV
jgi:hypothetical protein